MTITFVKQKAFDAKSVKDNNVDIDENWKINHIEYVGVVKEPYDNQESTNYKLSLQHKRTGINSEPMVVSIHYDPTDQMYGRSGMRITVKDDSKERYNYGRTVYGLERHRNIYLVLREAVREAEFIKAMFGMWRCTKLETTKKFGKIFKINRRI